MIALGLRSSFVVLLCVALTSILFGIDLPVRAATAVEWPQIGLRQVVAGLSNPTNITNAADGSGRLFITEQVGRVRIFRSGALLPVAFLDISDRVASDYPNGGRGLIGLAFPPDFAAKRHFYVDYTNGNYDIVIARFGITAVPDVADAQSEQIVLTIPHPDAAEHYGGQLAFGPNDGYLYISVGDGGLQGDPLNRAQDTALLLGKLLRIDVENGSLSYTIPPTNPFASSSTVRKEIWAYGLRNLWRFSFDRGSGDMYLADVGRNMFEEIDLQPAAAAGGQNYGWNTMEGLFCNVSGACPPPGLTLPVSVYDHGDGNGSITGGYVFRGPHNQLLRGKYFYGDFISGHLAALVNEGSAWQQSWLLTAPFAVSTFGEDELGNLYVANYSGGAVDIISSAGVDGWLAAATTVGAPPGGVASLALSLGNGGLQSATSVTVTASLPAGLTFAGATPSPSSLLENQLSWTFSNVAFQSTSQISLMLTVPAAAYGTLYPVGWHLSSTGPEANLADNTLNTDIMVARQVFLPAVER